MSRLEEFDPEVIAAALEKTGGLIAPAAVIVGCDQKTIRNYIARYPWLAERKKEVEEATIDLAESVIFKRLEKNDLTAAIFFLKCKGKARGYVERQEIRGRVIAGVADLEGLSLSDFRDLTDEQLEAIRDGRDPGTEGGGGT